MKKRQTMIIFALLVLLTSCKAGQEDTLPAVSNKFSDFFISTDELSSLSDHHDIVIVDARPEDEYRKLHIPRAVNITVESFRPWDSLVQILKYKSNNGYAIPPDMAKEIFGKAGIGADSRVIAYDSTIFPNASVIWALLKYFGHDNVRVLNGGIEKWASEGRPVTDKIPEVINKKFVAKPRPEMVATREYILDNHERITLLDLRSFEEYLGINAAGNPRGGHIPGAVSLEWRSLAGDMTVKSPSAIQDILKESGITRDKEIITYCNIGIGRSTYGYMVLKMLGYDKVRIYSGSFEDWSSSTGMPVTTTELGLLKLKEQ